MNCHHVRACRPHSSGYRVEDTIKRSDQGVVTFGVSSEVRLPSRDSRCRQAFAGTAR